MDGRTYVIIRPAGGVFQTGSPKICDFWGAETGGRKLFFGQVCRKTNFRSAFSPPFRMIVYRPFCFLQR